MALTAGEKFGRRVQTGPRRSVERMFIVGGGDETTTEAQVRVAVEAEAEASITDTDGTVMPLYEISAEEVGNGTWHATVTYAPPEVQSNSEPPTGAQIIRFTMGGGTQHITQSLQTVLGLPVNQRDPVPGFGGAIGVTDNGVEGVEIGAPAFEFEVDLFVPNAQMTTQYSRDLEDLQYHVNEQPIAIGHLTFAKGELLFRRAVGAQRDAVGDWELTFQFTSSRNVEGAEIAGVPGITKEGHHYAWVLYRDEDDGSGLIVRKPQAVYIERVYEYGDLNKLGLQ